MTIAPDSAALAAALVAGHALGDFLFQSDAMVRRKERFGGIALHALVVAACHAALLLPFFLSRETLIACGAIAVSHLLIDAGKAALSRRAPDRGEWWFALDQLLHLGVLAAGWLYITGTDVPNGVVAVAPATLTTIAVHVAAYAFNWNGVSAIVGMTLHRLGIDAGGPPAGRTIGRLERMFVLTLLLMDQWEAIGFLLAAKSLARFKALDQRELAEYYLVGTLTSLLGATATALVVKLAT